MIVQLVLFLQEILLTGSKEIYGEYLVNAQGEDVVAGTRTPQYITKKASKDPSLKKKSMEAGLCQRFLNNLKKF